MPSHGSSIPFTNFYILQMLLKAFPIPNNFLKMQLSERSQVKSKVNKECVRLLIMTGNFPVISKAK